MVQWQCKWHCNWQLQVEMVSMDCFSQFSQLAALTGFQPKSQLNEKRVLQSLSRFWKLWCHESQFLCVHFHTWTGFNMCRTVCLLGNARSTNCCTAIHMKLLEKCKFHVPHCVSSRQELQNSLSMLSCSAEQWKKLPHILWFHEALADAKSTMLGSASSISEIVLAFHHFQNWMLCWNNF